MIIRGVPYPGHNETTQEVEAVVAAVLDTMGLPAKPKMRFCRRLVNRKKPSQPGAKPPPVLISFDGGEYKRNVFAALPKWGTANNQYRFAHDIPPMLKDDHNKLEKMAFDLRQATKGTKTRVAIQDCAAILYVKKPGETKFSPVQSLGPSAHTAATQVVAGGAPQAAAVVPQAAGGAPQVQV